LTTWYIQHEGQAIGPVDAEGARKLYQAGGLGHGTLVCRVGGKAWTSASSDAELLVILRGRSVATPLIEKTLLVPPPPASTDWDVRKTATAHRAMLLLLLASLPLQIVFIMIAGGGRHSELAILIPGLACFALSVGMIMFACRALSAMRVDVGLIVVSSILLLAPCIGLITLLVISQVIQGKLRSVGLTCGLLGVPKDKLSAAGY